MHGMSSMRRRPMPDKEETESSRQRLLSMALEMERSFQKDMELVEDLIRFEQKFQN